MIPVNAKQLGYRIGTSDRILGQATNDPDGFIVLNQTNGNVFEVQGGVWITSPDPFPIDLLDAWYATVEGIVGYRIGTSDRILGESTSVPNGFLVYNMTNGNTWIVSGGVWTLSGTPFPTDLMAAWLGA